MKKIYLAIMSIIIMTLSSCKLSADKVEMELFKGEIKGEINEQNIKNIETNIEGGYKSIIWYY